MTQGQLGISVLVIFLAMLLAEIIGGFHPLSRRTGRDALFALAGITFQTLITPPLVGVAVGFLLNRFMPGSTNALAGLSFWMIFPVWFVTEEFCHYWVHRWSHEWRWMWKFHRTHHSAERINVGVVYRYNIFWTFMVPQTWFAALAIHLGLIEVFVAGALITFTVNVFTHTSYRWDLALRRLPGMNPVMNVLEQIVTLPDTHHAHHGLGRQAHMRGNYAVTIFLFDVMLGTARIPRTRQDKFGLPVAFDWKEELLWPIFRKRRALR